jgi:hypothetical protein
MEPPTALLGIIVIMPNKHAARSTQLLTRLAGALLLLSVLLISSDGAADGGHAPNDFAMVLGSGPSAIPADAASAAQSFSDRASHALSFFACQPLNYSGGSGENSSLVTFAQVAYEKPCGPDTAKVSADVRWKAADANFAENFFIDPRLHLGSEVKKFTIEQLGDLDSHLKDLMPLLFPPYSGRMPRSQDKLRAIAAQYLAGEEPFSFNLHFDRPDTLGSVDIPESENHMLMELSEKYMANKVFGISNARVSDVLLTMMQGILSHDFFEYNGKPYNGYSQGALLNLVEFGDGPVRTAAAMVLDYITAKFSIQTSYGRWTGPWRRNQSDTDFMMDTDSACAMWLYSGQLQMLYQQGTQDFSAPSNCNRAVRNAAAAYRPPSQIVELAFEKTVPYLQTFYGGPTYFAALQNREINGGEPLVGSPEVYDSEPTFLIAAGGVTAPHGLPVELSGANAVGGHEHYSTELGDIGLSVPTVLFPNNPNDRSQPNGNALADRTRLVRMNGIGFLGSNLCVAPGFACGLNPLMPGAVSPQAGWQFTRLSTSPTDTCVAMYAQPTGQDFVGIFEAAALPAGQQSCDTFNQRAVSHTPAFKLARSDGSAWGGRYTKWDGTILDFFIPIRATLSQGDKGQYPSWFTNYPISSPNSTLPAINTSSWALASGPISANHDGYITITNPKRGGTCILDIRNKYLPVRNCEDNLDGDSKPDAEDNCPAVYNPIQENCNEEAEDAAIANGQAISKLGDACDPVPCPGADTQVVNRVGKTIGGDTHTGFIWKGRIVANEIDVRTVGAHIRDSSARNGAHVVVNQVPTDYRFCQSKPLAGFRCDIAPVLRDSLLYGKVGSASQEAWNNPALPWHRMAVAPTLRPLVHPDRDRIFDPLNYGSSDVKRLWDYQHDNAFWQTRGIFAPDGYADCADQSFGLGTCLDGRIWVHAETDVGKDAANEFVGAVRVGQHGSDLANSYVDSRPDEATLTFTRPIPNPRDIFIWQTLPDPGPDVDPSLRSEAKRHESVVLLSAEARSAQGVTRVAVGVTGRHAVETGGFLSQGATDAMNADGARFLSSADPSRALNGKGAVAVLLSHDGTSVVDTVVASGNGLLLGSERRVVSGLFSPSVLGGDGVEPGAVLQTLADAALPPARVDFQAVYSGYTGQVFVLGGDEAATGEPLSDAWAFDLQAAVWRGIPIAAGSLHRVLAATYVFHDRALWILDESPRGRRERVVRLLRLDPASGAIRTLGIFPRRGSYSRFFLATTGDDRVLLTAARAAGTPGFVTALLKSTGRGVRAAQEARFDDELVAPPFIDERGTHAFVNASNGDSVMRTLPIATRGREHHRDDDDNDDEVERRCADLF